MSKNHGSKIIKRTVSFDYHIRRSARARKTRIVVTNNKIEVVAPLQITEQALHDFVYEKRNWINVALGKIQRQYASLKKMGPENYRSGVEVPYQGIMHALTVQPAQSLPISIQFSDQNGFTIHLPETGQIGSSDKIRVALTDWMKNKAGVEGNRYVRIHADKHQLFPRSLRIKTQKSRWGSCGVNDDINLNWLLILAPPKVMEYVVVHELCHLQYRNHSRHFWLLVADHMPDYQCYRNWLSEHGQRLMLGL